MKILKIAFLSAAALSAINCGTTAQTTNSAANSPIVKADNSTVISSHSGDAPPIDTPPSSKTTSTESPMARAIDVTQLNAEIERAQKNPNDKKALGEAYFKRAFALTEAAQYRSALGDFRRGLKLDPTNADAKAMHDQIIQIFGSINREPPKEGEEPPPLPFKTGNSDKTENVSNVERIVFKPNATKATATGNLKDYDDSKTFAINIKAGQTLTTEHFNPTDSLRAMTVEIFDPNGTSVGNDADASCHSRREVSPTVAGDYQIKVVECRKADAWQGKFDLNVSVK